MGKGNLYVTSVKNSDIELEIVIKEMNEEWLDFIIACRSGKPHAHDLVPGPF